MSDYMFSRSRTPDLRTSELGEISNHGTVRGSNFTIWIFVALILILIIVIIYQNYSFNKSLDDIRNIHQSQPIQTQIRNLMQTPSHTVPQITYQVAPLQNINDHPKIINPTLDEKKNANDILATYYFSPMCGHCTRFAPEWDKFSSKYNSYNIKKINCMEHPDLCANIVGVPHVVFSKNGTNHIYSGQRTANALESFYNSLKAM